MIDVFIVKKMSDSYTLAALRGLGMEGDDSYTSAALRGFGDESYTSAALRGCGCNCDDSYTGAALRGMGKFKKGSPEAKAFMARLRAMRASKSKGGKKLKGGIAFSTIATALGLIPTAIKGAHAIYKWIKGSGILKNKKGGRALILDPMKRSDYIQTLMERFSGRKRAALWPYSLDKAAKHANIRKRALGPEVVKYLEDNNLLDDAIIDTEAMKRYKKQARSALLKKHKTDDGIVLPELLSDEPAPALSSRRRQNPKSASKKSKSGSTSKYSLRSRGGLASLGLPDGKI